jgi:two-component system phosphoglycerate transport system response regulator PgtA
MNGNNGCSILVVDDNGVVLDAVGRLLKLHGFSVTPCNDANEVVGFLREKNFSAVLTDIEMPGLSGMELLKRIQKFNTEIPVVVMTGHIETDMTEKAASHGAVDFITKPFNPAHLVRAMEKAVDGH